MFTGMFSYSLFKKTYLDCIMSQLKLLMILLTDNCHIIYFVHWNDWSSNNIFNNYNCTKFAYLEPLAVLAKSWWEPQIDFLSISLMRKTYNNMHPVQFDILVTKEKQLNSSNCIKRCVFLIRQDNLYCNR